MRLIRFVCALLFVIASALPALAQTPLETMQRIRPLYPVPMSPKDAGEFLNRVAWEHRHEGLATLGKKMGNNCPNPVGELISCDFLVYSTTLQGYDVLIAWDAEGRPSWQGPHDLTDAIRDGARSIVLPVASAGGGSNTGGGGNTGGGSTDDLNEELAELHTEFDQFRAEVRARWAEDDTMFNRLAEQNEKIYVSLEEHRAESRKVRNKVFAWLTNWRNIVTVASGVIGGVVATQGQ